MYAALFLLLAPCPGPKPNRFETSLGFFFALDQNLKPKEPV
jgi:hypothetical protein